MKECTWDKLRFNVTTNSSSNINIVTNGTIIPIMHVSPLKMRSLAGAPINSFNSNEDTGLF